MSYVVLLFSLSVHESAHAWTAFRQGDPTARSQGRISLNPLVHIDVIGTVVLPLLMIFTGVPLIGWAKPVPVNPARLGGNWRQKFMVIAAAGPASNLVLATCIAIVLRIAPIGDIDVDATSIVWRIVQALALAVQLNVFLALFNMVPVPPLDGGNVLAGLLTGPMARAFDQLRPWGFLILYGLMLTGVLWTIIDPPASLLLSWLL